MPGKRKRPPYTLEGMLTDVAKLCRPNEDPIARDLRVAGIARRMRLQEAPIPQDVPALLEPPEPQALPDAAAEHFAQIARKTPAYHAKKAAAALKAAAKAKEEADKAAKEGRPAAPPKPPREPHVFRHALRGEELRQGPRGNGGPALVEPPAKVLSLATRAVCRSAELMFGNRWKPGMAKVLGVDTRQLRRLTSGEAQPHEHARRWARQEAEKRIVELQAIIADLADPVPAAPVKEPPTPPAAPARVADPRQIDIEAWLATLPPAQPAPAQSPVSPKEEARVHAHVRSMLPPGVPTYVQRVVSYEATTVGFTAVVELFDGGALTLKVAGDVGAAKVRAGYPEGGRPFGYNPDDGWHRLPA